MLYVSRHAATPLGDIRAAGEGDLIALVRGAAERVDWGRYQDAIAQAVSRGADVRWLR